MADNTNNLNPFIESRPYQDIWAEAEKTDSRYINYSFYADGDNTYNFNSLAYRGVSQEKHKFRKESLEYARGNFELLKETLVALNLPERIYSHFERILNPANCNMLEYSYYAGASLDYQKLNNDLVLGKDPQYVLKALNEQLSAAATDGLCTKVHHVLVRTKNSGDVSSYDKEILKFCEAIHSGKYLVPADVKAENPFINLMESYCKKNPGFDQPINGNDVKIFKVFKNTIVNNLCETNSNFNAKLVR